MDTEEEYKPPLPFEEFEKVSELKELLDEVEAFKDSRLHKFFRKELAPLIKRLEYGLSREMPMENLEHAFALARCKGELAQLDFVDGWFTAFANDIEQEIKIRLTETNATTSTE